MCVGVFPVHVAHKFLLTFTPLLFSIFTYFKYVCICLCICVYICRYFSFSYINIYSDGYFWIYCDCCINKVSGTADPTEDKHQTLQLLATFSSLFWFTAHYCWLKLLSWSIFVFLHDLVDTMELKGEWIWWWQTLQLQWDTHVDLLLLDV